MKKKWIAMVAALIFATSCIVAAYADASLRSVGSNLSLSFSNSTASCGLTIQSTGNSIQATMELWQGTTKVNSWSKSGTTYINLSGTHRVTRGKTYTLKATYTINGTSYTAAPVSKVCP